MKRWLLFLLGLMLFSIQVAAHKSPLIEYARVGVYEVGYTFIPRQPVVGDDIQLVATVNHPDGDEIKGKLRVVFSVYEDDSVNEWDNGKPYYRPNWLLIKSADAEKEGDEFKTSFVVDRPGNYVVTIDVYEDGYYVGQSMRAVDVEERMIGSLWLMFIVTIVACVLLGVRKGVL